ncbi:MAG: Gfo/Idh/MocA family oxidoreductase [Planctomycetota bacterium]
MQESSEKRHLRAAVIGVGIGQAHLSAFQDAEACDAVAVCDLDRDKAQKAADNFGISRVYTDAQHLFEDADVDVISVCTPNATHMPLSIAAMKAGKHVLCEKPMAMNTAEATSMIDVSKETGKTLGIHFNHRMNPFVAAMHRYAVAGDLGELYFGRTLWHRRRGIPARPGFVSKKLAGGGAMIDLGVHQLDQLLHVMGHPKIKSLSSQVYTKFAKVDVPDLEMDVDDFSVAFVRFENGASAEMEISWASHHHLPEHRVLQVYGTEGGARRDLHGYGGGPNDLTIYNRRHGGFQDSVISKPPEVPSVQADFLDAIREGRDPICSAEHGLVTMQILDALYASSDTGKEVVFDEFFASGSSEASAA